MHARTLSGLRAVRSWIILKTRSSAGYGGIKATNFIQAYEFSGRRSYGAVHGWDHGSKDKKEEFGYDRLLKRWRRLHCRNESDI
jgi:hypothetical protein